MTLRKSNRKHQSCPQAARRNTRIAVLAPTRRNTLITSGAVATPTSSPPAEETASHLSNYTSPDPPANAAVAQTALMPAPRTTLLHLPNELLEIIFISISGMRTYYDLSQCNRRLNEVGSQWGTQFIFVNRWADEQKRMGNVGPNGGLDHERERAYARFLMGDWLADGNWA